MQHDHALKKLYLVCLIPWVGEGGGGGWGGGGGGRGRDCVQNICYYVAAFVFPFDLIYNMTIF